MDAPDFDPSRAVWRTSTYTNNGGACVEVADNQPGIVAVRDSRDRGGPVLLLTPGQWRTLTSGLRTSTPAADG
jgi:hypothetical protein